MLSSFSLERTLLVSYHFPQGRHLESPATSNSNFLLAADDVTALLKSSGVEADTEQLALLIKNLEGKALHELIAAGSSKIATVSAAPAAGAAAGGAAAAAPVEEKKKEEVEQVDMGGLFEEEDDY